MNKAFERCGVRDRNRLRVHFVRSPVLDADDRGFAHSAAPGFELLALALAAIFAADVRLVRLDRPAETFNLAPLPARADAMRHMPSRLLGNANVPTQFH